MKSMICRLNIQEYGTIRMNAKQSYSIISEDEEVVVFLDNEEQPMGFFRWDMKYFFD